MADRIVYNNTRNLDYHNMHSSVKIDGRFLIIRSSCMVTIFPVLFISTIIVREEAGKLPLVTFNGLCFDDIDSSYSLEVDALIDMVKWLRSGLTGDYTLQLYRGQPDGDSLQE